MCWMAWSSVGCCRSIPPWI